MIFTDFFLAVFLVVLGTYFLFTSGSVAFLRFLKKRKKIYYRPSNQVTISGMLYRMKKNAAGLSNICIFSTMLLITLTCTVTLWTGMDQIAYYDYPYDMEASYSENSDVAEKAREKAAYLTAEGPREAMRLCPPPDWNLPTSSLSRCFCWMTITVWKGRIKVWGRTKCCCIPRDRLSGMTA